MKFENILATIGNTPHVKLNRLFDPRLGVWMKLERSNPGGSIKDRIGLAMIEEAEREGILTEGTVIIEPTSGNTGIGLAIAAAVKGYRLILTMPESMSVERRRYMSALGAEIVLTEKGKGMTGAIDAATALLDKHEKSWMPQQFNNPANREIHEQTTAQEIIKDFPDGLDYMITGVGTGGHITGCAKVLKQHYPNLKVFAVEPKKSAVISGGEKGLHRLQGIGAGFIPDNLDTSLLDGTFLVGEDDAFEMTRACAAKEAIFAGVSTGATLAAAHQYQDKIPDGSTVLLFNYDTGERYLSVDDLFI